MAEGLFSPPVVPDSFLERCLYGKNITHTAGLGQYIWSQSFLLKWVDIYAHWWCYWCSSNPGTIGMIVWNCSYVVMGSLRTAAVTLLLSSYSWAAVSPLHPEERTQRICWADAMRANWPGSRIPQLDYTGLREAGMEGYKVYLCFPEAEIPTWIQNLWWLWCHWAVGTLHC